MGKFGEGEISSDELELEQIEDNIIEGCSHSEDGRTWTVKGIIVSGVISGYYYNETSSGTLLLTILDKGKELVGFWSTVDDGRIYTGGYFLVLSE